MTFDPSSLRELRLHQAASLSDLTSRIAQGEKRIVFQAPTGFGKTLTAAHLIAPYVSAGKRVLFIVPRLSLLDQSVEAIGAEGYDDHIGVIQGQHYLTDHKKLVQIASHQTLTRRNKLPQFDMIIIDEAHMSSKALRKFVESYPDIPVVGFTATPWRPGMGKEYSQLIIAATTQSLIDQGYLTPSRVFAPVTLDLTGVKTTAGDYNQQQLAQAVNKRSIVGDIVKHYKLLGEDRQALAFCVDRAHAKSVQDAFIADGIDAEYIDCFTSPADRQTIISDFKAGKTRILCNVGVLTTGFDYPAVGCVIDAAPTKSPTLHVQKIGRGIRTAPGKTDAIILDHANNSMTLGLVNEIKRDWLCDGDPESRKARKQNKKDPEPRLCPSCRTVVSNTRRECPTCGHEFFRLTSVEQVDGLLGLFGRNGAQAAVNRSSMLPDPAQFYAEMQGIAIERAYKPGWAAVQFKERFGDWPNDPAVRNVGPAEPSLASRNWIRSKQIAWAKFQAKGRKIRL